MTEPSDDAIRQALRGTILELRQIRSMAIGSTGATIRWIDCDQDTRHASWDAARGAVVPLGLWPVLSDPMQDWIVQPSPYELLEQAAALDEGSALAAFRSMRARRDADDMGDPARVRKRVERACSWTERMLGRAPTIDEAVAGIGPTPSDISIERWFLDWEEANRAGEIAVPFETYPPPCHGILLLPTPRPWEVFAYRAWFGAEFELAAPMIVLARSWYERFGAEVRSQFGIWMDFVVGAPPRTLGEAFGLADEQDLAAADTAIDLGIWAVRGLARHLVSNSCWILSARP